jgi:ABC-type transport system involved in multi-copper enzyme maturation permease subunit
MDVNAFWSTLAAEAFKLRRKRRMLILAGLWWVVLPGVALAIGQVLTTNLARSFVNESGGIDLVVQAIASPYGIARLALVGPAWSSPTFYVIVVAALLAVVIGDERQHRMWKTVLTLQPARSAVLLAKLTAVILAVGILMAGALVASVVFGTLGATFLPTDASGDWGTLLAAYALQWLHLIALVAFAALSIYLARNLAIGMIVIFFVPTLLEGLYGVYAALVGFQPINRFNVFLQTIRMRQLLEDLPRFFFTSNVYAPARSPSRELVAPFGASDGFDLGALLGAGITLPMAALVSAAYAAVLLALLLWRFLRADVD